MPNTTLSLAAFKIQRSQDSRLAWLTHDIDLDGKPRGLEIGALDNPTLMPDTIAVEYVDYTDTAGLQAHPHEDTVRRQEIVSVDHIWPGSGSLAEVCKRRDYDFAIASHVIEHVPNVLGWFKGIHEVLRPGGVFNLAIPDRRYTFDIRRMTSTLGEMVEAYLYDYSHPSVRQVFDHTYYASAIEPGEPWQDDFDLSTKPLYSGDHALGLAYAQCQRVASESKYYDSHCWVFTPRSFISAIHGATELGLFPFIISNFASTSRGSFEFFVSFRKEIHKDSLSYTKVQLASLDLIASRLSPLDA